MPGVPNASMARQVERAGFDAVYISGAGLANCTAGVPDIGLLTLNEVATLAGFIAQRGENSRDRRCRYRLWRGGECRAHDLRTGARRSGRLPYRRPGISETLRTSRRQTARRRRTRWRRKSAPRWRRNAIADFLIIARTDSRAVENFDGAVKRANAYVAAGADAIFPEALQTTEEFRDFAQGSESAAAREHDGVRQKPVAQRAGAGRARLSHGHFPAERFSRFDESDRGIFPGAEESRHARANGSTKCRPGRNFTRRSDYDPAAESWPDRREMSTLRHVESTKSCASG